MHLNYHNLTITVAEELDAVYIMLNEKVLAKRKRKTKEIEEGIIVDLDDNNKVIGIEILNLSSRGKL